MARQQLDQRLGKQASGESKLAFDPLGKDEQYLTYLNPEHVELDPNQPRKDPGDISELASSVAKHGIVHPIIVEPLEDKRYRILSGERRYRAAIDAQLSRIPCIIRSIDEHNRLALQLIENLHRKDLNPVEEATSYQRLLDEFQLTQRELAERVGKGLGSINEILRILQLPQQILEELVRTSEQPISKSLLLEIAKEEEPATQEELWKKAKKGVLSVRKIRSSKQPRQTSNEGETGKRPKKAYSTDVEATVVVQSKNEDLPQERIITALEQALDQARGSGS